ncbi:MAG: biotin--[acetyl-CoA-carboxylase] ligase [Actinobacteria bacterium]|nr:biotin--[acetyl-CoA-carboxylase] ligase [Actinomycetota bacterium]
MNWKTIEYDKLDSTNNEAKRLILKGEDGGLVVWAQHQLRGRGRHGRTWWNLPGKSLLASFVFENIESGEATRLVSISTIAAVRKNHSGGPLIKWPNDLVYQKKKVGGILSEALSERNKDFTIVGLGLNLNYSRKNLILGRRFSATSLSIEENKYWETGPLLLDIKSEIDKRLSRGKDENLAEYRENLAFLKAKISMMTDGENIDGIFYGVDDRGFLILKTKIDVRSVPAGVVRKARF